MVLSNTGEYECRLGHKSLNELCFLISLILTNKERFMGHMKFKGSLGCSNHEMEECKILRELMGPHNKVTTVDLRRADLGLFRNLLGRVPWNKALEGRRVQETWLILKDHLFQVQE